MTFTVFTPTYNRKDLLKGLYQYLSNEQYTDLEWIVVDDGSNDETKEYIESLYEEAPFNIRYFYQDNSGKYIAFNKAIEEAEGEYFVCIDSDDRYVSGAFKKLELIASKLTKSEAGICFLSQTTSGQIVGSVFPDNLQTANLIDLYYWYGVKGDKGILHKTSILKRYKFPTIKGEKFITESVLYAQISKDYTYRLLNEALEIICYHDNGLSAQYRKLLVNNPQGALINYKLIDQFQLKQIYLLKNTVRLISFVFYLKINWFVEFFQSKHKFYYILCTPIAAVVTIIYKLEQ